MDLFEKILGFFPKILLWRLMNVRGAFFHDSVKNYEGSMLDWDMKQRQLDLDWSLFPYRNPTRAQSPTSRARKGERPKGWRKKCFHHDHFLIVTCLLRRRSKHRSNLCNLTSPSHEILITIDNRDVFFLASPRWLFVLLKIGGKEIFFWKKCR